MEDKTKFIVGFLALAILFVEVQVLTKQAVVVQNGQDVVKLDNDNTGAQSGQEQFTRQYFRAGYQNGCLRFATSSSKATFTLTAQEIAGDRCFIDWTPNLNTTLTLMSTTTMSWLGANAGDSREFIIRNASSTANATITLAEGTGSDFQKNEDTADLAINGLDTAILRFVRKANSDVMIFIDEYTEG